MRARRFFPCLAVLALTLSLGAQTAPAVAAAAGTADAPRPPPGAVPATILSRITGLFDIDLPQLPPPGTFRLHFDPHFGDLLHRSYLDISTGVEWSCTDFLQFRADADAFGTHGFRRGPSHFGISELHLGGKYLFREFLRPDFATSVGLNTDLPVGHPPADFTDGHNHFSPYFILQHHSPRRPRLTTFAGANLDFVTSAGTAGAFGRNEPHHHSLALNTGIVYDLGQLKWTLQTTGQTTAVIGGGRAEHYLTIRPSVLWYVPKRYTFHGKTQWIVGLGARAVWGPDGTEFGTSTRLQADVTFSQAVDRLRSAFDFQR